MRVRFGNMPDQALLVLGHNKGRMGVLNVSAIHRQHQTKGIGLNEGPYNLWVFDTKFTGSIHLRFWLLI